MSFHQTTILIVDDNADTRQVVGEVARLAGFAVRVAIDGVEALKVVRTDDEVDAVVSDWFMPGLDGLGLAKRVRALRPDLPVILMTGYTHRLDDILQAGAVPLIKPFTAEAFELAVRDAIDARENGT